MCVCVCVCCRIVLALQRLRSTIMSMCTAQLNPPMPSSGPCCVWGLYSCLSLISVAVDIRMEGQPHHQVSRFSHGSAVCIYVCVWCRRGSQGKRLASGLVAPSVCNLCKSACNTPPLCSMLPAHQYYCLFLFKLLTKFQCVWRVGPWCAFACFNMEFIVCAILRYLCL